MQPKYNINEVVYMLTSDLKIRPVLISGVKLTRSSETYVVDLENEESELITLTVDVSKLWSHPADIANWMLAEWREWNKNQKEWEGQ